MLVDAAPLSSFSWSCGQISPPQHPKFNSPKEISSRFAARLLWKPRKKNVNPKNNLQPKIKIQWWINYLKKKNKKKSMKLFQGKKKTSIHGPPPPPHPTTSKKTQKIKPQLRFLNIFRRWHLQPLGVISRLRPRVHADHLTVRAKCFGRLDFQG